MATERIELDVSKALADIARLKGGLSDLKKEVGAVGVAADAAFDEGFALGMVDALDDLQREYAEMARAAKVLQNAMRGATEPALVKTYAQSIAQLETGMRKLEGTAKSAGVSLKQANKEAGTGKQVFEGFFGTFTKATVIIAAIEAVRRFASQAIDLATQTKKASLQFEAFLGSAEKAQKVVGELQSFAGKKLLPTQAVLDAGKGLLAFGVAADRLTPTLSQIADISKATGKNFGELTTIFGKAKAAGVLLYAEDINQLVDAGIPIIGEFAKQLGVSTDQVKKLASEGKITFEELQLAFFNLTAEGGKFAGQAEAGADAGDRFNVAWTNALTKVGVVLKPAWDFVLNSLTGILDSVSKLASSTGFTSFAENAFRAMAKLTPGFKLLEKLTDRFSGKNKGNQIDEQADKDEYARDRRAYEESLNERERLEKEAQAARNRRNKVNAAEAAKLEKELARLRIDAMAEGMEKEIAQENLRFSELKKQLDRYHIDATGAIEQHNKNILGIELKYTLQRISAENELIELRKAQAEYEQKESDKGIAAKRKYLEQTREIRESEVDITEAEFNNLIKALEAGGAKKKDIEKAQLQFDEQIQAQRLQSRIDFLKGILAITDQGNKAEITLITNQIAALQTQLDGLGQSSAGPGAKKGLLESLGLDFDEEQLAALKEGLGDIASIFGDLAAAQEESADAAVRAAEKQIEAAQRVLDEERKLADQGYASNVSNAERNLEAAKAQEAKALEQKKKAQRQQALLDTASQVSSLITASAQTFKVFNGPLLPIGIALVAAMFGAFLAAKARASQAAKFKHGGEGRVDGNSIIVGASHEGGGVGIEAEGGEFFGTDGKRFGIVNKKMTKKHFELLSAINADDRGKMREALENLTRPNMKRDAVMNAIGESGGTVVIRGGGDKKTHGLLSDIKKNGQRSRTVEGGYVVERNGNHVRKTKIK